MIKKTLYFGNPAYLSLRNAQLVIKLPGVEKAESLPDMMKAQAEVTKPIEDLGVVVLITNKLLSLPGYLMPCSKIIVRLSHVIVRVCLLD